MENIVFVVALLFSAPDILRGSLTIHLECNYSLDICLHYDGYHANKLQTAVEYCNKNGEKLLEIKSKKMQEMVRNYLKNLILKYFRDKQNFKSFINLKRLDFEKIESGINGKRFKMHKHESNHLLSFKIESLKSDSSLSLSENQYLPSQKLATCERQYFLCVHSGIEGLTVDLVKMNLSWYEARQNCFESNRELVDNDYLGDPGSNFKKWSWLLQERYPSLALPTVPSGVKWVWADEDTFTSYTNWNGGCENTSRGDDLKCSVITGDSTWMASRCHLNEPIPVICMLEGSGQSNQCEPTRANQGIFVALGIIVAVLLILLLLFIAREILRRKNAILWPNRKKSIPKDLPLEYEVVDDETKPGYVTVLEDG